MNIVKIVKECPRAWEECSKFLRFDGFELLGFVNKNFVIKMKDREIRERVLYRELFDYFDSVGIVISVTSESSRTEQGFRAECNDVWHWDKERTVAEQMAFEYAFEVREKQIEEEYEKL